MAFSSVVLLGILIFHFFIFAVVFFLLIRADREDSWAMRYTIVCGIFVGMNITVLFWVDLIGGWWWIFPGVGGVAFVVWWVQFIRYDKKSFIL